MPISKPFVVATEGRTMDGRNLPREWLTQAAENYDPAIYTAVLNLDHYLAFDPDSTFSAHGKVLSLATQSAKILGEERLQLTATVEASEAAAKLQAGGKKCFASIEIIPNFADTGKAYLTGLALTDTPAALGTQPMKFSTFSDGADLEHMALAQETSLEFEAESPPKEAATSRAAGLLDRILSRMSGNWPKTAEAAVEQEIEKVLENFAAEQKRVSEKQSGLVAETQVLRADLANLKTAHEALNAEFAALKEALGKLDASGPARPLATGGDNTIRTDC
ncbi:MAG: GPO family capsid scaffolding protein [Betaproteobacteria bacterium]|nr:GPO family capsid scaffolding protein [Betaproteobacteria bacterium]